MLELWGLIFISFLTIQFINGDIVESASKHLYKTSPDENKKLTLAGVGIRVKKIGPIKANVYSVGLYVDKSAVISKLKKLKQIGIKQIPKSEEFIQSLTSGDFTRTIVLRMARDVSAVTMINALAESIKPRMIAHDAGIQGFSSSLKEIGDLKSLNKFQSILMSSLKNGGAKTNTEFSFESSQKNKSLCVSINGKKLGSIDSPLLCQALIGVYVDKNAVSPSLKECFCKTFDLWS
eukprot:gene4451-6296_t